MLKKLLLGLVLLPSVLLANSAASLDQSFEKIKANPQNLLVFLKQFPKGGELHYHWDGSSYPENLLYYGRNSNFCYDVATGAITDAKDCPLTNKLNTISNNPGLYQTIVDNWSLSGVNQNLVETNKHVFQYFIGAEPLVALYSGNMLAEEVQRASAQHEDYMELIYLLDLPQMISLGNKVPYNDNFSTLQKSAMAAGAQTIANSINQATQQYYQQARQIMHCDTAQAETGCDVTIRFQISAMRNFQPQIVFTQLLISFLVAQKNPLVVGVNIVGPENEYYSIHDYALHMRMISYFHKQYPNVHLSLHAGELSLPEAAPEAMYDHIAQAINIADAERIGHGSDIASELQSVATLHTMAQRHIAVETCLTSNEKLLGLQGDTQPLALYLHYHVPVVLSTDDEGVLRTDLTQEYWKAVTRYHLSYSQIKNISRNALTYNFLPGKNLWENRDNYTMVKECRGDKPDSNKLSVNCDLFLEKSPKARLQWKLEGQFKAFEKQILREI